MTTKPSFRPTVELLEDRRVPSGAGEVWSGSLTGRLAPANCSGEYALSYALSFTFRPGLSPAVRGENVAITGTGTFSGGARVAVQSDFPDLVCKLFDDT